METERLILDSIRESDKEDYFNNISHDTKVLETLAKELTYLGKERDLTYYAIRRKSEVI